MSTIEPDNGDFCTAICFGNDAFEVWSSMMHHHDALGPAVKANLVARVGIKGSIIIRKILTINKFFLNLYLF